MPRRKVRCRCVICRSRQDPIDYRTAKDHVSKYGLHIVESPCKSVVDGCQDTCLINASTIRTVCGPRQSQPKKRKLMMKSLLDVDDGDNDENDDDDDNHEEWYRSSSPVDMPVAMDNFGSCTEDNEHLSTNEVEDSDGEFSSESDKSTFSDSDSDFVDCSVETGVKDEFEPEWSIKYDTNVYSNGIATEKMQQYPSVTVLQWLAMKFHMFSSHPSMSKTEFSSELKLHSFLSMGNTADEINNTRIPTSYKEARRMIDPFVCPQKIYYACVNDCILVSDSERQQPCSVCNSTKKKRFIYLPLGPRLARYFGEVNLAKLLQSHPGDTYQLHSDMWDVHDSPMWKAVYSKEGHFEGHKNGISLAFELDGVNPFHNIGIQYSMTPMMFTLLNLPRKVRNSFGNIILIGIIPGSGRTEASKLDPYLEIMINELSYLTQCKTVDSYLKAPVQVKIRLLMYILDYPGLSKLFNLQGSGGISACHWCHVKGEHCPTLKKVIYPCNHLYRHDRSKDDQPTAYEVPRIRDEKSEKTYRNAYDKSSTKINKTIIASATGCKGKYELERLTGHNRIDSTQPDACHTVKDVTQNIMKLFTNKGMELSKIVESEEKRGRPTIANDLSDRRYALNQSNMQKDSKTIYRFILTENEMKVADERACSIRPPLDFGLKASPFINKTSSSLKSHDWKQLACQGILKFCLRGCLTVQCRKSFFKLLDAMTALCEEHQCLDDLDVLESKVNEALIAMQNDLPLSLQNITTHILHHVVKGIRTFGPVYGTWMYVFERFNSWICKRTLNMRHPESTVIETYRIYDWCQFMIQSGKMPEGFTEAFPDGNSDHLHDHQNTRKVPYSPGKKELMTIHNTCTGCLCTKDNCVVFRCYHLEITNHMTGRSVIYSSKRSQKSSAKTNSSFIHFELSKGDGQQKLSPGKYLYFGQIDYFICHTDEASGTISKFASITLCVNCQYDEETSLWFTPEIINQEKTCKRKLLVHMDKLSAPLVTAVSDGNLWFLNSKKKPQNCVV